MLLLLSTTIVETVKVFGFVRNSSAQSRILFCFFFCTFFPLNICADGNFVDLRRSKSSHLGSTWRNAYPSSTHSQFYFFNLFLG